MAYPFILLAATVAVSTPTVEAAQATYTQCLSTAFEAAVNTGTPAPAFTAQVPTLCQRETAAYRAALIAKKLASDKAGPGFKPDASRAAALQTFADTDAANRQAMLVSFGVNVQSHKAPAGGPGGGGK